jgi:hypothetical protein
MDRTGQILSTVGDRGDSGAAVSRDGTRIVISANGERDGKLSPDMRDRDFDPFQKFIALSVIHP